MAYSFLRDTCDRYKLFVVENVELIGEIEAALKWMSYFIAGRGKELSPILSELMYSTSNILILVNDMIIRRAVKKAKDMALSESSFKITLTLIEYLEVFAEVGSQKVWGSKGKWLVIAIIQILKMVLRLFLLLKEKSGMLFSPPILPLTSRQRMFAQHELQKKGSSAAGNTTEQQPQTSRVSMVFTLKRSGRTVRTVSSAPPITGRTWKVPIELPHPDSSSSPWNTDQTPTVLSGTRCLAEFLHIVRPMTHLIALQLFGSQSWKPWLLACGLDVASLRLANGLQDLRQGERGELRFRTIAVLYYLLRSPFYDRLTKERALKVLAAMSRNIPGARFICNPLIEYLPSWQQTYFYAWGC